MNFVPCRHGRRRMFTSKNARVSQQGFLENRFKPPVESSDLKSDELSGLKTGYGMAAFSSYL